MLPYLLLGGAQIAVGAAAIFARFALGGAGPLAVGAARLAIAAIALLLASGLMHWREAIRSKRARGGATHTSPIPKTTRRQTIVLACAGFALAVHFAAWIGSLEYTTVAISTLLVTCTPIFTALYDAVVLKRGLSTRALLGFAGGALGLVMVVGFDTTAPPILGLQWLGAALALFGAAAIGTYLILVREVRAELGTRTIVTRTYTWAALALVVAALAARQPLPPIANAAAWGGIAAMAIVSQLIGHTALNASLRWFSPSAVSFATLLEPVIAGLMALAVFGEAVPWPAAIGAAVLLASIAVVLREERSVDWPEPI